MRMTVSKSFPPTVGRSPAKRASLSIPFTRPAPTLLGLSNTIVTTLILKELQGEPIAQDVDLYNRIYLDTFHSYIGTYEDKYPRRATPR